MHDTALRIGCLAIDTYANSDTAEILEIGAGNVNGSLRDHTRSSIRYVGVDFDAGPGVDIVIEPDAPLPVPDDGFDLVIASSVLEHDPVFWLTFLEMCRKARSGGYIYINVPSNGEIHRYPSDNWRFYPDSGRALTRWAVSQGMDIALVESFVAARIDDRWNDFVAVFRKGNADTPLPSKLLHQQITSTNVWIGENNHPLRPTSQTEDLVLIDEAKEKVLALQESLSRSEQQIGFLHAARAIFEDQSKQDRQCITDLGDTLLERQAAIEDIEQELAETRSHVADLQNSSTLLEQRIQYLDTARLTYAEQARLDRHRIADLDSTLIQRQEEIAQTIASLEEARDQVASLSAATTLLAEREAVLTDKLVIESAWVFRLAGERRAAENTVKTTRYDLARTEQRLQTALKHIDDSDHRLALMQQAVKDARTNAQRDAETIAAMRTDRDAALSDARLQSERIIAEHAEQARADLEKTQIDLNLKIAERFSETALLTRLLRDEEIARRRDTVNIDWLRQVNLEIASRPWWWGLVPSRLRLRMVNKRLLKRQLFNSSAYLARYPDVAAAGMDALQHYILHGMSEGRICARPILKPENTGRVDDDRN